MKKEEVYGHIDHTLLMAFCTTEQIEAIAEEALKYGTASICIPASFVNYIHNKYRDVNICTVIGFPLGYSTTPIKVAEAKQAIEDGANEIDMVINIGWAKEHMSLTVAAICGFAGVVTNTEAFTTMLNAITGINMSPMLICAVVVAVMCMLTGGSSTGQLISLPLIAPKLLDLGLNVNAIHRIACFAATTLDSMPYSGAILMLLPMCRMKLREIYPPMFITTVIATTCGTIAVIVMCALFPGLC